MNLSEMNKKYIRNAAKKIKLDPNLLKILERPMRILEVSIPLVKDNGEVEVFTGYRCQYNDARTHKGRSEVSS